MSKNLIFCADGTWPWHGPGERFADERDVVATNVFKLFISLQGVDLPDPQLQALERERGLLGPDGAESQKVKYIYGGGDPNGFLVRTLGNTVGCALITQIVRGYTYLSRNYNNGDRIFIIGFSRGAYVARALAGLIASKGLLDARKVDLTDKIQGYRLAAAVWHCHRAEILPTGLRGMLEAVALDLPHFLSVPVAVHDLTLPAPVEVVAVWETVGSLGIPEFVSQSQRIEFLQFADLSLSANVRHGLHAVAVDEQRADFSPTLWNPDPRVTQVLFAGSHADVGGGYPISGGESGLADCALSWMMDGLTRLGLRFSHYPSPDPLAPAHQPWTYRPWTLLPVGPRIFPPGLALSSFLVDRMRGGPVQSTPSAAPAPYRPEGIAMEGFDSLRIDQAPASPR